MSKVPSSSAMVKANDDGVRLAHAQVENEIRNHLAGNRAGSRGRVLVPYGKPTLKRNRPSLAVLMVLGGGGKRDSVWIRT